MEDNPADAELVQAHLGEKWPGGTIRRVAIPGDFLTALPSEQSDLVLSDFSMPAFNGMEALTFLRQHGSATPLSCSSPAPS